MHTRYIFVLTALAIISAPLLSQAQVPFGGNIAFEAPCNNGLLLTVLDPFGMPTQLMWNFGELPYLMFIPPHIGQNLLGEYVPAEIPCFFGPQQIGSGYPIEFHGESM